MRILRRLVAAALCLSWAGAAHAEDPNDYGARGRTVIVPAVDVQVLGGGFTQPSPAWSTRARLTAVHFVRNNFALGGTLLAGVGRLRDTGFDEPRLWDVGADLDAIFHAPMTKRLSLRFWCWVGVRHARARVLDGVTYGRTNGVELSGELRDAQTVDVTSIDFGFTPELIVHLSSSLALSLGPRVVFYLPISRADFFGWSLSTGPSLSYSIDGPHERASPAGAPAPRFSARGRNLLSGYVSIGIDPSGSLSYARFVRDRIALGGTLFGAADPFLAPRAPYFYGGGAQLWVDVPLGSRWSLLGVPEVGYRRDVLRRAVGELGQGSPRRTQEVQLTLSLYPAVHVFEALLFGVGPFVSEHVRVAAERGDPLGRSFLTVGVRSLLVGSF